MILTNFQMEQAIIELNKHTDATGKLGYAVARNLQTLKNAATPYLSTKEQMAQQFGEPDGENRFVLKDMDKAKELVELMQIEVDVDVYQIDAETFFNLGLTAAEMEPIVWMVKGD